MKKNNQIDTKLPKKIQWAKRCKKKSWANVIFSVKVGAKKFVILMPFFFFFGFFSGNYYVLLTGPSPVQKARVEIRSFTLVIYCASTLVLI